MAHDAETSNGTLRRIADILGISIESFFDGRAPEDHEGALQCMALWQGIRSPAGRRKALALLRQIADEEAKGSGPIALDSAAQKE